MIFTEFITRFQKFPIIEFPNNVNKNITVSVCVLAYQHEDYIVQCLEGILNQKTTFGYEILIGEDDSTDSTREICIRYAERYPNKIKLYLHNRKNNIIINNSPTGLFSALYNMYNANGEFIAYCDGDDFWNDPLKLQKQVDFLKTNLDYVLAYHEVKYIDELNNIFDKEVKINQYHELNSDDLIQQVFQPLPVSICFRNKIRDIPIEITEIENADNFLLSMLGSYGKGKYLDNILCSYYRVHNNSYWSSRDKGMKFLSKIKTYKVLAKYYKEMGDKANSIYFSKRSFGYLKQLIVYIFKLQNLSKSTTYFKHLLKIYFS